MRADPSLVAAEENAPAGLLGRGRGRGGVGGGGVGRGRQLQLPEVVVERLEEAPTVEEGRGLFSHPTHRLVERRAHVDRELLRPMVAPVLHLAQHIEKPKTAPEPCPLLLCPFLSDGGRAEERARVLALGNAHDEVAVVVRPLAHCGLLLLLGEPEFGVYVREKPAEGSRCLVRRMIPRCHSHHRAQSALERHDEVAEALVAALLQHPVDMS
eukprot:753361-Hanusia_phi.AAC.1